MITLLPPKSSHLKQLLSYLAKSQPEGRTLLSTNLVGRDAAGWQAQIESLVAEHRPRMKKFVKHMILSFAPGDGVSKDQLLEIVPFYLEKMGYRDAPYVAFLHADRPHWHVHIVTTPTTLAGERISESWDWPRSERVARQIERRWRLRQVRGSKEGLTMAVDLPDGIYQLAGVKPGALANADGRLARGDVRWHRKDWTLQQIKKSQGFLAGQSSEVEVLVRGQEGYSSILGFRGVRAEQLEALKADGYTPALTVQIGDRFDIALRTHAPLSADDKGAMRAYLVTTYELPETRGVYRDAIRMPGLGAPGGGTEPAREAAVLVSTQEGAFPASEWLAEQVRFTQSRQELKRLSQRYEIPPELENQPSVALREVLEPASAFPDATPLSAVQQQVVEARREASSLGGSHLSDLSTPDLADRLGQANEAVIALARNSGETIDPTSTSVRELLSTETEVARRRSDWLGGALRAERDLSDSASRLEAAQLRIDRTPSPEAIRAYRNELATYKETLARLDFLERGSSELSLLQVRADRERHAQALVGKPIQQGDGDYRRLVQREVALTQRLGEPASGRAATPALDDPFQQQRTLAALEQTFRQQLAQGRADSVGPYEQAVLDHLRAHEVSGQARQQAALAEAGSQLGQARGDSALSAFLGYSRELSRDPKQVSTLAVRTEGANTLRDLARQVAEGDLAPQHLRRLNGAIILNADARQLPAPSFNHPRDPVRLVRRYREARGQLIREAGELATGSGKLKPHQLASLFSRSSEVIAVHQKLEAIHRQVLKIADPGRAPKGTSQIAWNLAWLEQATRKGLAAPLARAHLANVSRLPVSTLGLASPGRSIAFSYYAARFVVQAATRFAQRVLAQ